MFDRMIEKRNEGGFTLIELLIVIIILAILAAIVVFAVGNTSQNAKNAACSADAKTVETALEAYKAQAGTVTNPYGPTTANLAQQAVTAGYLRELPNTNHYEIWTDGQGGVYVLPSTTSTTPIGTPTNAAPFGMATTTFDAAFTSDNFDTNNGGVCNTVPV